MASQSIVLAHQSSFWIGTAEVRPASRELAGPGGAQQLEPRVMQVLVALHDADGKVLSKDDLIECCWDGRVVGEDAINRVIGNLRRACVAAGAPFRVETIPRVGYRIAQCGDDTRTPASPPTSRRAVIAGTGVVLAAAAAGGAWLYRREPPLPAAAHDAMARGFDQLMEGTPPTVANATALFREAVAAAPDRADPWGALAVGYLFQAQTSPPGRYDDFARRAAAAASKAQSIDPANGYATAARIGLLPPSLDWMTRDRRLSAAVRAAPGTSCLMGMLGGFYWSVGRLEEAFGLFSRFAPTITPSPRVSVGKAELLASMGRPDEAARVFDDAIQSWPRNIPVWFTRFKFLMFGGAPERALAMLDDEAMRPAGPDDYNFGVCRAQALAIALPSLDRKREAIAVSMDSATKGSGYAENAMLFTSFVGALDDAFGLAETLMFHQDRLPRNRFGKAQADFANRMPPNTQLLFQPASAPMRRDPRMASVWQRLGLQDYWRTSGHQPDFRR